MRKTKPIIVKTATIATTTALMMWAGVGHLPTKHTFSHSSVKNFTQAATELLKLDASNASAGGASLNLVNAIRGAIGMVVGYGSHASYVSLVCNGVEPAAGQSCDGPPQIGIVGAATAIVNELPAVAGSAGITSCETAPSSGTFSGTDSSGTSISLTFSSPTHAVPAGWVDAGAAFSHRVVFNASLTNIGETAVPIKVAYEFNCGDNPASYVAISMDMDNAPSYKRDIAIYNGTYSATEKGVEVYMAEHSTSTVRAADMMRIAYNESTHKFRLWSVISTSIDQNSPAPSFQMASKVLAHGDYTTGQALVFSRAVFSQAAGGDQYGAIDTAIGSHSGSADESAESDPGNHDMSSTLVSDSSINTATNGSPRSITRLACVNFNSPSVSNAPGHSACAGLAISAPEHAPAAHSGGRWDIHYLFSMASHLETL